MNSRRDALRSIAAGALAPLLQAQHQHAEPLVQIAKPQPPKYIAPDDFKLLSQLVDVIIPRTDTPGASEAGVPLFIDRAAGKTPKVGEQLKQGLASLRDAGFAGANSEKQIALLKGMEAQSDPFFKLIKDLTIDGYYTSRDGLVKELGYHGNTFLKEFPGCTHPEHQVEGSHAN